MDAPLARRVVAAALLTGLAADLLVDRAALGVNVPIGVGIALLAIAVFERGPVDRADLWLPIVALAAGLGPALRTDPSVVFLDVVLVAVSLAAWAVAAGGVPVTRRTAAGVASLAVGAVATIVAGGALVLGRVNVDAGLEQQLRSVGRAMPIVRGLAVAGPVVVIFAALLASADAVFSRGLELATELPIDPLDPFRRALFAAAVAWPVAGLLVLAAAGGAGPARLGLALPAGSDADRGPDEATAASGAGQVQPAGSVPPAGSSGLRGRGRAEILTVLIAVDVLFAVFVVLQVAYLFGGRDTLELTGLTYSEYARQGYFQLVAVVVLAGLLLLVAHEIAGRIPALVAAGLTLLGLTGVILASAAVRLKLYQDAYGWTELRFYVAASISWLALAVLLAGLLLARDRMRWLAHGLAVGGVVITLAVSALGPQAFVNRENLARALDPSRIPPGGSSGFDAWYAISLGDDAVPDLVAALDRLPVPERSVLLDALSRRRDQLAHDGAAQHPAAWNLAREQARAALERLPAR